MSDTPALRTQEQINLEYTQFCGLLGDKISKTLLFQKQMKTHIEQLEDEIDKLKEKILLLQYEKASPTPPPTEAA